jgi:hypothetical protein
MDAQIGGDAPDRQPCNRQKHRARKPEDYKELSRKHPDREQGSEYYKASSIERHGSQQIQNLTAAPRKPS